MDVQFHNIDVDYGKTRVLHQVYGKGRCGHILAIIGPSGAGKTSLLNVIAGRIKPTSGSVKLGGKKASKQLRRRIAYVTQEDVFFPHITLRETLMFSAMLKLPESMTFKEKCERVQSLEEQFDLNKCTDTIMGDVMVRGLSGGERKRANIACEMINNADVIILDEPTSGLDSVTAHQVMSLLQTYAEREHKTVITTLHQPNSRIFHMCEDILVLSSGKVAYNGPEHNIIEFLASNGFQCPSYYNPADFILEKLKESEECKKKMVESSLSIRQKKIPHPTEPAEAGKDGQINLAFESDSKLESIEISRHDDIEQIKWRTGFFTQYRMLFKRHLKQIARSYFSFARVLSYIIIVIFGGLLWFQIPKTADKISSRVGLFFFCQMNYGFEALYAAIALCYLEKTVIRREHAAGMYRVSAYYVSKLTSEFIKCFLEPLLFYTVVYWLAGMSNTFWIFLCSLLVLQLNSYTCSGLGVLLSLAFDDMETTLIMGLNHYVLAMMLGGFFVVNDTIWFQWTKYLSILYYCVSAATKLEFIYGSGLSLSDGQHSNSTICTADDTLAAFESNLGDSLPIWLDFLIIVLFNTLHWLPGYIILRWVRKRQ